MYQALYRKWRPRTFDDVVGQEHITETLKRQVASGRLSHAYLFTGTRGTGKTTCAKILARAINCENPQNGNPCNVCPSCRGIENGSILDVLELDGASNNGVEHVRALRDEAVYTPTSVKKRVYIIDEVHMVSSAAFNALLKIMEEPPDHVMFILATTEVHKVPATIKSRCQQFSFRRIAPEQIARRLSYVAMEEGIGLTPSGAGLLARLADGGMRDALSLLDQCSGGSGQVDEQSILQTLGLAGNVETAALMERIAARDTSAVLEMFGKMYAGGRDVGAVLGELSTLARDLLLQKTAPRGGAALMTGGYDETTLRTLGEQFQADRLMQILTTLQSALADLARSSSRRTDGELCLLRLTDETLDTSLEGLSARVGRLEAQLARGGGTLPAPPATAPADGGSPVRQSVPERPPEVPPAPASSGRSEAAPAVFSPQIGDSRPVPPASQATPPSVLSPEQEFRDWEEEMPPLPEEPPELEERDYSLEDLPPVEGGIPAGGEAAAAGQVSQPPSGFRFGRYAWPASAAVPTEAVPVRQAATTATAPASGPGRVIPFSPGRPAPVAGDRSFWPAFADRAKKRVNPMLRDMLESPTCMGGIWNEGRLTLWVEKEWVRGIVGSPFNISRFSQVAEEIFGVKPIIQIVVGCPPEPEDQLQPERDMMDDLMQFGAYDNIKIE